MATIAINNENIKISMLNRIVDFVKGDCGGVATLKEIYRGIKEQFIAEGKELPAFFENKVRSVIYKNRKIEGSDKKAIFKCKAKGVWMVIGDDSAGLIIHGDGRRLEEIEDKSIDFIITDHPWLDKKNHTSGNQKNFAAAYENTCFRYTEEDFKQKARVLKDGAYLVEFLPMESESNYKYLYEIKDMAAKAGFKYYAKLIWLKAPNSDVNTGRTTKGMEDIMIFSKGKPRRLSERLKPYMTKNMLDGRVDIPAAKGKNKKHQAEKNVEVYEYLMDNLSLEGDVGLDQFAGSFNAIQAGINKNRFMIAYDCIKDFIKNATDRFKAVPLYVEEEDAQECYCNDIIEKVSLDELLGHTPEHGVVVVDCVENNDVEENQVSSIKAKSKEEESLISEIEIKEQLSFIDELPKIPKDVSDFQLEKLKNLVEKLPKVVGEDNIAFIKNTNRITDENALKLNEVFKSVFESAYENVYARPKVQLSDTDGRIFDSIKKDLDVLFKVKVKNEYLRPFYIKYKIETEDFCKYLVKKKGAENMDDVKKLLVSNVDDYLDIMSKHISFKGKDVLTVKRMIFNTLA